MFDEIVAIWGGDEGCPGAAFDEKWWLVGIRDSGSERGGGRLEKE